MADPVRRYPHGTPPRSILAGMEPEAEPRYPDVVITAPDTDEEGGILLLWSRAMEALTEAGVDDAELDEFTAEMERDDLDEDGMTEVVTRWVRVDKPYTVV